MDLPSPEERFFTNVLDLTQLIHDLGKIIYAQGYELVHPNLISLCGAFLANYDKTKLIRNFISYSYPHWEQIRLREDIFFDEHAMEIFKDLPLNNVNAFKIMYTLKDKDGNRVVSIEDREDIWAFFESLVKICIKYIHQGRRPATKTTNGERKPIYTCRFCDEVELEKTAKKWGIKLEF